MFTAFNSLAAAWLEYFGYAVVQNTLFLAIIFGLLHVFKNAAAPYKYALALLGIIKLLIPPFLPGSFGPATALVTTGSAVPGADISLFPAYLVTTHLSLLSVFFVLWLATILVYLLTAILATARFSRQLRNATFVKHVELDRWHVDLYTSPNISVPMSLGIRPKRIYVPQLWDSLTPHQKDALLRHELAHIQRWDGLAHLLQMVAQAIYFFHPLVWLLNERINEYREMACDERAVERTNVTPLAYSRTLVHVAENMLPIWSTSSASALIKQRNKLYHRVNYLVKEKHTMNRKKRMWWMVVMVVVLMLPLSWYCSKEAPPEIVIDQDAELSTPTSETQTKASEEENDVWVAYDTPPQPIGGFAAIQSKLVYPEVARNAGVEGRVVLNALIDATGNVTETKILKSLGDTGCDEAAIAAINATQWTPAQKEGKAVAVRIAIPLVFKLK